MGSITPTEPAMDHPIPQDEIAARERDFDAAAGALDEQGGKLSPAEIAFIPEAMARAAAERGWSVREEERWRRTCAARSVLREWLDETGYEGLLADPHRGEVAAKLYATWAPAHRAEPFCESDYMVTGIYVDLGDAMNAHGLDTFDARCAEIGKRMVTAAIDYVLACHKRDAEALGAY